MPEKRTNTIAYIVE